MSWDRSTAERWMLLRPNQATCDPLNLLGDPPHQQRIDPRLRRGRLLRRQPRILVNVHPGAPPIRLVRVLPHRLTGLPSPDERLS
jgi:hypothetical protein